MQPVHPGELVGIAGIAAGIAVRQVDADRRDTLGHDLNVSRLRVLRTAARQRPVRHLERDPRQHGHAVVGFLADRLGPVANLFERQAGKRVGFALDLLQ